MSDVNEQRRYYEHMMDEVGAEYRRCIANLQDENEKLREQVASLTDRSIRIADKMDCLEAENAKLRELVHEALLFGDERSYQEIRYRLKQEARELGVEVDE